MKILLFLSLFITTPLLAQSYPQEWWVSIPRDQAASWEILPQDAAAGEVILSKRTELGIFSNFGATPFELDGLHYASVEGLWQALKYPDPSIPNDPRAKLVWPHTRAEVMAMVAFDAKRAGNEANLIYKANNLKEVSYGQDFFDYNDFAAGSEKHLKIITRALRAKLDQTPGLWDLLLKTGCLILKPDHTESGNSPASYRYFDIYMKLREERQPCSSSR
ncbi:MAG: NADAR family protein [Bacteriovoracaceae bacterium]|nr:NADAR family protein [Bacteriovoracaceae bacterium]